MTRGFPYLALLFNMGQIHPDLGHGPDVENI